VNLIEQAHPRPLPQAVGEKVRGKLTANAPLAPLVWFKSGGSAEWLFEP
jgi:UDP-N-acetylmuramate dehydrogenase